MLSSIKRGPLEALLSGVFAASAGVTGKLALDLESRNIVVGLCHQVSESLEQNLDLIPISHFEICESNEVRRHCLRKLL